MLSPASNVGARSGCGLCGAEQLWVERKRPHAAFSVGLSRRARELRPVVRAASPRRRGHGGARSSPPGPSNKVPLERRCQMVGNIELATATAALFGPLRLAMRAY